MEIHESNKTEDQGDILQVDTRTQYRTVEELFAHSQPNSVYYSLLVLSVFIVASGLLLDNSPIVIGGMLVTPLLTPILMISLAIVTGKLKALKIPGVLLLKSVLITVAASLLLTFAFGAGERAFAVPNTLRTAFLYFVVAGAAGVAAAVAWVRKEVADILPGTSIAVALLPPLSLIGIEIGLLNLEAARFYLYLFLLNFVGIFLGAMIVFSLLKFKHASFMVERKVEEAEKKEAEKKAEKAAEQAEKKLQEVKRNVEAMQSSKGEEGQGRSY